MTWGDDAQSTSTLSELFKHFFTGLVKFYVMVSLLTEIQKYAICLQYNMHNLVTEIQ